LNLTTGKQRELVWDVLKVLVKWSDRTMMGRPSSRRARGGEGCVTNRMGEEEQSVGQKQAWRSKNDRREADCSLSKHAPTHVRAIMMADGSNCLHLHLDHSLPIIYGGGNQPPKE
jgi:hypothetical protein